MYVKVAPAQAARALQAFVKQSGGSTTYSAALEFFSGVFGFNNYRAQKAYAEQNKERDPVVFEAEMEDWNIAELRATGDLQDDNLPETYRLSVEHDDLSLRVCVVPKDVKDAVMASNGRNVLDFTLEINHGLPCLHITNDPAGEMLLSVFGHAGGILLREDEASMDYPTLANEKLSVYLEEDDWKGLRWYDQTLVMNNDTQAKYAEAEASVPAESPTPTSPFTVDASFDSTVSTEPDGQWFDLTVFENGEPCDSWQVGLECRFTDSLPEADAPQFCATMAEAFTLLYGRFKDGDGGLAQHALVQLCLEGGLPVVKRLIEVAHAHPDASYAKLEKLYRMTAAVRIQAQSRGGLPKVAPTVAESVADVWPGAVAVAGFNRMSTEKPDFWYFDLEVFEDGELGNWSMSGSGNSQFRFDAPAEDLAEFKQAMEAAFTLYYRRTGSVSGLGSGEFLVRSCLEAGSGLPKRLIEVAQQNPEASATRLEQLFRAAATSWLTN